MNGILERLRRNPKAIASVILPLALLVVIALATGGGLFGSGSSSSNPPVQPPAATATPPRQAVRGQIAVAANHLHGSLWEFVYTVHDTGPTPIGGFQLNGPRANLFAATRRPGWAVFGGGVCAGNFQNMLVYWSTGANAATEIKPGQTVTFRYEVNTSGTASRLYSLSWGQASAQFGQINGPAPSSLPASGPCKA
jgi:hypothetical protein